MARIRTIPKAVEEIKRKDPGTYVTAVLIRKWVKSGYIKPVPGSYGYTLINLDQLEDYLEGRTCDS